MFFFGVGLAFMAAVSSEAFIEAQDPSMKGETNVKRSHNGCSVRNIINIWPCTVSSRILPNGKKYIALAYQLILPNNKNIKNILPWRINCILSMVRNIKYTSVALKP